MGRIRELGGREEQHPELAGREWALTAEHSVKLSKVREPAGKFERESIQRVGIVGDDHEIVRERSERGRRTRTRPTSQLIELTRRAKMHLQVYSRRSFKYRMRHSDAREGEGLMGGYY